MPVIEGYEMPDELYYTEDHAWLKVEEDNKVRIGLSDFAQKLAGEISFVKVPKVGKKAVPGKLLFSLQSGKWAGKVVVPVAGTIVEANKDLLYEPQLINENCYGTGWVAVIKAAGLAEDLAGLKTGEAAHRWLRQEAVRLESEQNN